MKKFEVLVYLKNKRTGDMKVERYFCFAENAKQADVKARNVFLSEKKFDIEKTKVKEK